MKQLQFEKLQLLCWSRWRKTQSASETRRDIVPRGRGACGTAHRHSEALRGDAGALSAVQAFTGRSVPQLNVSWQGFEDAGLEEMCISSL